jgi:hypothetical protein
MKHFCSSLFFLGLLGLVSCGGSVEVDPRVEPERLRDYEIKVPPKGPQPQKSTEKG